MVEYFPELWQSCKDAYKNPILIVPFLVQGGLMIVLIAILAVIGFLLYGTNALTGSFDWAMAVALGVILGIPGLILFLMLNAYFSAGILNMASNVTLGKRATGFYTGGKEFFSNFFFYQIWTGLLFLLLAAPMILFIILAVGGVGVLALNIVMAVLFGFVLVGLGIVLAVALFFAQPLIVRKNASGWDAIKGSFQLMRKHAGHVWASWGITLLFGIMVGMGVAVFTVPIAIAAEVSQSPAILILQGFASLVRGFVQLVVSIIAIIYMFRMYNAIPSLKKGKKA